MDFQDTKAKNLCVYCRLFFLRQAESDLDFFNEVNLLNRTFQINDCGLKYYVIIALKITKEKMFISAQRLNCANFFAEKVIYEQKTPKDIYNQLKNEKAPITKIINANLDDVETINQLLDLA